MSPKLIASIGAFKKLFIFSSIIVLIDFLTWLREYNDSEFGIFNSKLNPLIYPYFCPFNLIHLFSSTSTIVSSPRFLTSVK